MVTRIQKWGNSQGIRLSKALLADAEVAVGDAVEVAVRDGAVVITPVRRVRGGHDLSELVRHIPGGHAPDGFEWGPPVGGEVW